MSKTTTTKFGQIAEDVRNLGRMFKSVQTLVDVLDEVGKIEQIEAEANTRALKAKEQAVAADTERLAAESELAKAKAAIADAKKAASDLLDEAKAAAGGIVAAAGQQADAIVASANGKADEAKAVQAEIAASVSAAEQRLNELDADIKDREAKLDKIKAQAAKVLC